MKRKLSLLFTLLLASILVLTACSSQNKAGNTTGTDPNLADKAFNETIDLTGVNKDKKSEEENGKRVIMDSVALAQVANVLDIKLAGVPTTKLGRMPKRYDNTVQIGLPMNPNMEVIKSINPSIVYAPDSLQDWIKEGFEKNKIPYKFVDIRSVNGLYAITEDLAKEFGKVEKFNKLKKEHDEFFTKFKNKKKPKVLVLMGLPGSYMAATEKSYVGNLVKLAGGENIIKGNEEFKNLNLETALNDKPDFILRTAHAMPETVTEMFKKEFENNKSWSHFDAVKNNKVIATLDASGTIVTFLYSTGEPLMRLNDNNELFEVFFKNGNVFFETNANNFKINYKDGKPLYKTNRITEIFFNRDGEEIPNDLEKVIGIRKIK